MGKPITAVTFSQAIPYGLRAVPFPTPGDDKSHIEIIRKDALAYRWTGRPLTLWELIRDSDITTNEVYKLSDWVQQNLHSPRTNLFIRDGFIAYAIDKKCFRMFLLLFGYIEEVTQDWLLG